jgi:hypothetical protein
MKRLRKLMTLSGPERRLLLTSALLLAAVRSALSLFSLPVLCRVLSRLSEPRQDLRERSSLDQVLWAVETAAPHIPAATCLTRALVMQVLLSRRGYPSLLRIGVARNETGELIAHAWLEGQERILSGGSQQLSRFVPLLVWEPADPRRQP